MFADNIARQTYSCEIDAFTEFYTVWLWYIRGNILMKNPETHQI